MALVLTSALLSRAGFEHGFTTREAGDFARGKLAPPAGTLLSKQVHSALVHEVTENDDAASLAEWEGDALVSARRGVSIGVRTADCIPALLVRMDTRRVAAVHAGWRGVTGRIAAATLAALGPAAEVRVALGPAIGSCCFEVGRDVADQIASASDASVVLYRGGASDKAFVDLRRALQLQLEGLGVARAHIEHVGGCTVCSAEGFHSYRREGSASGRMLATVTA